MPIYEYTCPKCHEVFEEWLKFSEIRDTAVCPVCGAQAGHIISKTAFVLKGGGWYVTDYGYRKGVNESGSTNTSAGAEASAGKEASPAPVAPAPQAAPSSASAADA